MANGKCRMHGGATPKGVASPHFKTGRYSTAMPKRMRQRYEDSLANPDLRRLDDEIALIESRILDLLQRVDSGESGAIWKHLRDTMQQFDQVFGRDDPDSAKLAAELLDQVRNLIMRGFADSTAWRELGGMLESKRRLVDTATKIEVNEHFMISAAEFAATIRAIQVLIKETVSDKFILRKIAKGMAEIISDDTPTPALIESIATNSQ
jgi:hypothetical protein